MKRFPLACYALVLAGVIPLVPAATVRAATAYTVIDLGTWGGDNGWSCAFSINNPGQVVGWICRGVPIFDAVQFDTTGNLNSINLGTLGGSATAISINDGGLIVGHSRRLSDDAMRATLFHSVVGSPPLDLGSLGGVTSIAYSINNSGQIVGLAETSTSESYRAVLFDANDPTGNRSLGTLDSGDSVALSINNAGAVVGWSKDALGRTRAVVFDTSPSGAPMDLGTLGGQESWAQFVGVNGQIIGSADAASGYNHATLFDPDDPDNNIDLGTLGGPYSEAWSVNSHGQIVGWSSTAQPASRATLFDPTGGGQNINLNDLIPPDSDWILKYAYSINDDGWIIGQGIHLIDPVGPIPEDSPWPHAFLLVPNLGPDIPEPTCLALLALGGLTLLRRRK